MTEEIEKILLSKMDRLIDIFNQSHDARYLKLNEFCKRRGISWRTGKKLVRAGIIIATNINTGGKNEVYLVDVHESIKNMATNDLKEYTTPK